MMLGLFFFAMSVGEGKKKKKRAVEHDGRGVCTVDRGVKRL